MKYIVFMNDIFDGFKMIAEMDTEAEAIKHIEEKTPWLMFYIFKKHHMGTNMSVIAPTPYKSDLIRFEVYTLHKVVAGEKVEKPNLQCHNYALSHRSSKAWFFTDSLFGDEHD